MTLVSPDNATVQHLGTAFQSVVSMMQTFMIIRAYGLLSRLPLPYGFSDLA